MYGNGKWIPVFTFKAASVCSETIFIQSCQAVGPDRMLFRKEINSLSCVMGSNQFRTNFFSLLRTRCSRDTNFLSFEGPSPNDKISCFVCIEGGYKFALALPRSRHKKTKHEHNFQICFLMAAASS